MLSRYLSRKFNWDKALFRYYIGLSSMGAAGILMCYIADKRDTDLSGLDDAK